ncbi:DUF4468 domain-containing protein [Halosquirtibacter laminarini]|uniref:DUF4468 domain-containing protein n=1 Tax=Halosquirtibacter laminarini TaxID=3374600 RepID=UPI0037487EFE
MNNISKSVLYQKSLIYFNSIYKSPKDVISSVEDQLITIHGVIDKSIRRNSFHVFDMDYTITFQFKDGKVRINSPSFVLTAYTKNMQTLHVKWTKFSFNGEHLGIYGKNDKLKSARAKKDLEVFYNNYIKEYFTSIIQDDEW